MKHVKESLLADYYSIHDLHFNNDYQNFHRLATSSSVLAHRFTTVPLKENLEPGYTEAVLNATVFKTISQIEEHLQHTIVTGKQPGIPENKERFNFFKDQLLNGFCVLFMRLF